MGLGARNASANFRGSNDGNPNWSNWRRKLGNVIGNSMGGLRGRSNLASWAVAGGLAYYLWVKPSQDLKREQEQRVAAAAAAAAAASIDPSSGEKVRDSQLQESD